MTRVLVLGAGELGLAILNVLTQHPAKPAISVLLRPSDSPDRGRLVQTLGKLGVAPIYAELTSPDLHTHLAGYDIVISATGFAAGRGTQRHICDAAIRAGVPWLIPWQFGVDYDKIGRGSSQPLFDEQLDVRDALRAQAGTRWTIISTGIFTSFLFDEAFGVVQRLGEGKVKVTALGAWENKVTMTSAEDIGRLTAGIVLDAAADGGTSGVEYIAGDTTTFEGLAKALEDVGWDIQRELLEERELQLAREKRPDDVGPKYQSIWARNVGVAWDVRDTWNGCRGIEVQSMRAWISTNYMP
jgi:threonine dehydrogenase-like Zn-dependent dehydrogenase